jgi:hypothetical protein
MIPDLAVVIGLYVITRMAGLLVRREPKEHALVAFLAAVTILATLFVIGDIVMRGSQVAQQLQPLLPK